MGSIYDFPSWSRDKLTGKQKERYDIHSVGVSTYSLRTKFSVVCRKCGATLHGQTSNPSAYIEIHDKKSCWEPE